MISPDYPASEAGWATVKFEPGQFLATPGALAAIGGDEIANAIARHLNGDWGEVCDEDRAPKTNARWRAAHGSCRFTIRPPAFDFGSLPKPTAA